jgi:G protein beta subunit-like protein
LILATAGYDHCIKFWDVNTGMTMNQINYPDSHINKLAITVDRKYIAVAAHQLVKVYEISMSPNVPPLSEVSFEGHSGNITALGFQKDNKWFFTASEDGTLKVFDFKTTGYMRNFDNNGVSVNCACLHPNQGEIFFGDQ